MSLYLYKATVAGVVDGDTLDLVVDLGHSTSVKGRYRLGGVNAPKASTEEGQRSKEYVLDWFSLRGDTYIVQTVKDRKEKYGRYLAWVYSEGSYPGISSWVPPKNTQEALLLMGQVGVNCLNFALINDGKASWYWGDTKV